MKIRRTANAGVLLKLDNATILLDGVCREVFPYLCTPSSLQEELLAAQPDVVAFTHHHKDHFDPEFARKCSRKVMGTAQMAQLYPNLVTCERCTAGEGWKLSAVPTRHLGKGGLTTEHFSYILEDEQCIWFMGDASPVEMKKLLFIAKPDILIVPYAYLVTPSALQAVAHLKPKKIILLHMPLKEQDPDGLWQMIEPALERFGDVLVAPGMGQVITV